MALGRDLLIFLVLLAFAQIARAAAPNMTGAFIASEAGNNTYESGLAGYWKLDEPNGTVAADSSGGGNNGTINAGVTFNESGRVGRAMDFNGAGGNITVPNAAPLQINGTITLAAWVNIRSNAGTGPLVGKWWDQTANRSYLLTIGWGGNYMPRFLISEDGSYSNSFDAAAQQNITPGVWTHIAGTYNGTVMSMYIDGQPVSVLRANNNNPVGSPTRIYNSNADVMMGTYVNYWLWLNGGLDDVRIYNRSLSPSEVQAMYNQTLHAYRAIAASPNNSTDADGNNLTHVYAYYLNNSPYAVLNMPFDSNVSSTSAGAVRDYSGNNNNGTLGGGTSAYAPTWNSSGKVGGAYTFDGSNDYIALSGLEVNTSAGAKNTVEFWMYWDGTTGKMPFGWTTYDLYFESGCFGFNTGNSDLLGASHTGLANRWAHVAAIFFNGQVNSTNNELYIDGVKQNLSTCTGTHGSVSVGTAANISGWNNDNGYKFGGSIDQFMIYNRSLTANEIAAHYNLQYNRIPQSALSAGQAWNVSVTPNDASSDGPTMMSSQLAVTASPGVDSCGSLSYANTTYRLAANLSINGSTCFNVTAANVTLDCNGHGIAGNSAASTYGVYSAQSGTAVKNCNISGFMYGISFSGVSNAVLENNNVSTNVADGFAADLNSVTGLSASNNSFRSTGSGASYNNIYSIQNSTLYGNTFYVNSYYPGVYMGPALYSNFTNNSFLGQPGLGAQFYGNFTGSSFAGNTFNGSNFGALTLYDDTGGPIVGVYSSGADVPFTNNTFIGAGVYGIYTYDGASSYNLRFANNTISSTATAIGINSQSFNITFLQNNITANVWVNNANSTNSFNNSNSGNIYYFANGTASWNAFNISDLDGNHYADYGTARPFNATTVGGNWSGVGGDWHPYTATALGCINVTEANAQLGLASNLSINGSTCFQIQAANVTLDCNGYSITGNNTTSTYGVYSNQFNTTVRNCVISNFQRGVYFSSVTSGTIQNTTASTTHSSGYGIYLSSSSNNNITNSTGTSGSSIGILLQSSSNYNTLTNTTGTSTSSIGIYLDSSSNNTLSNSTGTSTSNVGIRLESSSSNTIANSTGTSNSSIGIYLESSSNNTISNSTGTSTSGYGVYLYSASNNTIANSTFTSNSLYGILIRSSSNNTISNSTGTSASDSGIRLDSSSTYNQISNSAGTSTSGQAILFDSSSNYNSLTNSTGTSSSSHGIYILTNYNTIANSTGTSNSGNGIAFYASSYNNISNSTFISNSSYGVYVLSGSNNNNLTGTIGNSTSSHGIYIDGGSNVSIDCQGKSITGTNTSSTYGVYSSQFNTTVKNCVISNFATGIMFSGATNGTIQNTTSSTTRAAGGNDAFGIYLFASSYNTINNTVATSSGRVGIRLDTGSNSNTIINSESNSTAASSGFGIHITSNSHNNNLANTTAYSSLSTAFYIDGGSNVSIDCQGRSITGTNTSSTYGVYSSQFNTTVRNCVISNFQHGVFFSGASNGTISNNTANTTALDGQGILINTTAENNSVSGNYAYSLNGSGIYVRASNNNTISNNTVRSSNSIALVVTWSSNFTNVTGNYVNSTNWLAFYGSGLNLSITNNIMSGYGYASAGTTWVMHLCTSPHGTRVINNTVSSTGGGTCNICGNDFYLKDNTFTGTHRILEPWGTNQNNTFINNTVIATNGQAFWLGSALASGHQYANNTFTATGGIAFYAPYASPYYNLFTGNQFTSSTTYALYFKGSNDEFADNTFSAPASKAVYLSGASNNSFTGGSMSGAYGAYLESSSNGNNFTNITLSATNTHIYADSGSGSNRFHYNTFSGTGAWVSNSNSTNMFNTSVGGVAQGNYYSNYTQYNIYDSDNDGWADAGTQYPFNATTIAPQWSGSGADFGPAFAIPSPTGQGKAAIGFVGTPVTLPVNAATLVSVSGGNATQLNLQINSTTLHWQGFYGNITGALQLAGGTSVLKTWNVSDKAGQVYISTSSNVNFALLNSTSVNLTSVDTAFSFLSGADDSANRTGVENANSAINVSYYPLAQNTRPVIYSRDSTGAASWQQIILSQGAPAVTTNIVFTGIIRNNSPVFNGQAGDFQMVVPASGILNSTPYSYYFYGELR